jgi:glycosyltransferase involved in cell wall biosynthesis
LFFFFSLVVYKENSLNTKHTQPVSVIIAAHNELGNLKRLLPVLLQQQYPEYEIIIADDRSTDGSIDYFKKEYASEKKMQWIRIESTPQGFNAKKYALTKAVEMASYDTLLFTDADCLPASDEWIQHMVGALTDTKQIAIGYSPYMKEKGWLNLLIRYETCYTAIQYFSFALARIPYMGVGRNIAYSKKIFYTKHGHDSHRHVTGGDDDLFMRDRANAKNTAIVLQKKAHVYSIPKKNYCLWMRQKIRHLSVSIYYKSIHKCLLGLLYASHFIFYLLYAFLLFETYWVTYLFIVRTLLFILIFVIIAKRLGETIQWWMVLPTDIVYILNHLAIAIASLLSNRKNKWI